MKNVSQKSAFVIAAPSSGSGKTVITLGVMALLQNSGLRVQPFKVGPDYIDPGFHTMVCGRSSYNLDTWMMKESGVKDTFHRNSGDADVSIIEGVMGLFDGKGGIYESGTAHVAKLLGLPVILVLDISKMAGSAAAILYGFENFDPELNIAGVILNRSGSTRHEEMVKTAIRERCRAEVIGSIPRNEAMQIPESYLGLKSFSKELAKAAQNEVSPFPESAPFSKIASVMETSIDMERLLALSACESEYEEGETKQKIVINSQTPAPATQNRNNQQKPRIAIAQDEAFSFYYKENLEILESMGAELLFFSPLRESTLPQNIDGLYFGGGYPEQFATLLSKKIELMKKLKNASDDGMGIYAECGGLMFLGSELIDIDGKVHSMTGIFPWKSRMLPRRRFLGYREVLGLADSPFLPPGEKIRGHEFHYSEIENHKDVKCVYKIEDEKGEEFEGYFYNRTLASYIHLHFSGNPDFAERFVNLCRKD